jgi:thioredoxin 1
MIRQLNDENLRTYLNHHERVVVKFYADWCGICKAFAPEFEKMVQEEKYRNLKVVEINAPENPKARLMAGVYSLPFFASFYKGELLDKCPSAQKDKVAELMNQLLEVSEAVV